MIHFKFFRRYDNGSGSDDDGNVMMTACFVCINDNTNETIDGDISDFSTMEMEIVR